MRLEELCSDLEFKSGVKYCKRRYGCAYKGERLPYTRDGVNTMGRESTCRKFPYNTCMYASRMKREIG